MVDVILPFERDDQPVAVTEKPGDGLNARELTSPWAFAPDMDATFNQPSATAEVIAADGIDNAETIELAMFAALTVYGQIDPNADPYAYDDNYSAYLQGQSTGAWAVLTTEELGTDGFDADHGFTGGGLYVGLGGLEENGAEALAATATVDGEKALVLSFRGMDGDDGGYEFQTFWWRGVIRYYQQLQPLIAEVSEYASDPENGIDQVIVTGHSLGGTMADFFTLTSARAFIGAGIDLEVVSVASAGIPATFPVALWGTLNAELLEVTHTYGATTFRIQNLDNPDWYTSINATEDTVHYPEVGYTWKALALRDNVTFDSDVDINLPNIRNGDTDGTFGAEHNGGIYWVNVQALTNDPWFPAYQDQTIIMGISDYENATDYGGAPLPSVPDYSGPADDDWSAFGGAALRGTQGGDYILGLTGNDLLFARGGDDLLSGGDGGDWLLGGRGNDHLDGGTGGDILQGQAGDDVIRSSGEDDRLLGGFGADIFIFEDFSGTATIRDFETAADVIDLSDGADDPSGVTVSQAGADTVILYDGGEIVIARADTTDVEAAIVFGMAVG